MRLAEIIKEEKERCITCDGLGKEYVGDEMLGFTCPDCKGEGYIDTEVFEKEELEEIKVTKTLAGKRKKPTETMQGKLNKKKKNAGAPEVSLKTRDAHELANITLKGEYTS